MIITYIEPYIKLALLYSSYKNGKIYSCSEKQTFKKMKEQIVAHPENRRGVPSPWQLKWSVLRGPPAPLRV